MRLSIIATFVLLCAYIASAQSVAVSKISSINPSIDVCVRQKLSVGWCKTSYDKALTIKAQWEITALDSLTVVLKSLWNGRYITVFGREAFVIAKTIQEGDKFTAILNDDGTVSFFHEPSQAFLSIKPFSKGIMSLNATKSQWTSFKLSNPIVFPTTTPAPTTTTVAPTTTTAVPTPIPEYSARPRFQADMVNTEDEGCKKDSNYNKLEPFNLDGGRGFRFSNLGFNLTNIVSFDSAKVRLRTTSVLGTHNWQLGLNEYHHDDPSSTDCASYNFKAYQDASTMLQEFQILASGGNNQTIDVDITVALRNKLAITKYLSVLLVVDFGGFIYGSFVGYNSVPNVDMPTIIFTNAVLWSSQ